MKQFLDELYQIEPELREKNEQLEKVVVHMTNIKPIIHANDNFKKILKNQLDSAIKSAKPSEIQVKNGYFRMFWYVFGAGVLASFALSFSFLGIFQAPSHENIVPMISDQAIISEVSKDAKEISSFAMTPSVPETIRSMKNNVATPEIAPKESMSAPIANIQDTPDSSTDALIASKKQVESPATTSLMSADPVISSNRNTGMIAYVGEEISLDVVSGPPPSTMNESYAKDSAMGDAPAFSKGAPVTENDTLSSASGMVSSVKTEKSSTGMTFATLLSQAQEEAGKLIGESDRQFYELSTPRIAYISQKNIDSKDIIELVQVYIFPLTRIDGKVSTVKEIQVVVP